MKNTYYLFALLFLCFFISSNTVHGQRMDTPGNQWNYSGSSLGLSYSYSQKIGEDTLVNGLQYYKIYTSNTGEAPWIFYNNYLRQDNTSKVYYKSSNQNEELLFDFNLAVNDSLFFNCLGFECVVVVEVIDSIELNDGSIRKQFKIPVNGINDYWIMGVGSSNYGIIPYSELFGFDNFTNLDCFLENDELVFPESSDICFPTNVEETLDQLNIQIYPNPVFDDLKILDQNQQLVKFELLDLTGKLIKNGSIDKVDEIVNLQNIQPGMYLFTLHTKTGAKFAKKILKK